MTRDLAIDDAARAWADFYLWAMEQPNAKAARRRAYTGAIADDILEAAGITFATDRIAYGEAVDAVVAQGYTLAGGKHDLRGSTVKGCMAAKSRRAKELRIEGLTLRAIAAELGISTTTAYKLTRRAAA